MKTTHFVHIIVNESKKVYYHANYIELNLKNVPSFCCSLHPLITCNFDKENGEFKDLKPNLAD